MQNTIAWIDFVCRILIAWIDFALILQIIFKDSIRIK